MVSEACDGADGIVLKKSPGSGLPPGAIVVFASLVGLSFLLLPAHPLRSNNLVFYLPNNRQVIALKTFAQAEYLPLLPVLNLVGTVRGLKGSSNSLMIWFGARELEFRADSEKVKVDRATVKLREPVRAVEGQWLVPLDFLNSVLPRITSMPIEYRTGTRRVFIGDVKPATLNFQVKPIAYGDELVLEFSVPVSVRTASENGKWIIYLSGKPIEPQAQRVDIQSPYLKNIQFDDQDGVPKVIITPVAQGLDFYPTWEENGKRLRAALQKPVATRAEQAPSAETQPSAPSAGGVPSPGAPGPQEAGKPAALAPAGAPPPAIVLDAGHGGDDVGARGQNGVLEKNLVAQLVVQVRTALLAAGRYRVALTRVGDVDPNFEDRALTANTARPIAFVSFHAGDLGSRSPRVVVYTYQPPLPDPSLEQASVRPLFVPWEKIQEFHLAESRQLAQELQNQLVRVPGLLPRKPDQAPVRILRSVDAPAVAIEMGSLTPTTDPTPLTDPEFQHRLAEAVAQGIEAFLAKGSNP